MKSFRLILYSLLFLSSLSVVQVGCGPPAKKEEKNTAAVSELDRLNKLIIKDSNNPDLLLQRAHYYIGDKKFQSALNDMNHALTIDSGRTDLWMTKAEALFGLVQVPPAIDAFKKVVALDPKQTEAYMKLAELSLYMKDYQQSLSYANDALKNDSKKIKAYFIKGFVYKETGDTARSISSFQTCVELDPNYYDAMMQLGILYAAKKNKLALQYYNSALRVRPGSIETLYGRAMFYQESEEFNLAMEDYATIIRLDPKNKDAHFNLGYIHLAYLKVYREAIRHFSDAIACDSTYIEAWYNRGISFENLGDVENAAHDYKKALSIYPKYEMAKAGLKRVSR